MFKDTDDCKNTSHTVKHLIIGREYEFKISAQNKYGIGQGLVSQYITISSAFNIPDSPGKPELATSSDNSITISFKAPEYDGGSKITGRLIQLA